MPASGPRPRTVPTLRVWSTNGRRQPKSAGWVIRRVAVEEANLGVGRHAAAPAGQQVMRCRMIMYEVSDIRVVWHQRNGRQILVETDGLLGHSQ